MDGIVPADWADAFASGFGFASAFLLFRAVWRGIQWIATFKTDRADKLEERADAATRFLIGQLTGQVETLLGRCNQIEAHHAQCLEELASLRGYVDGRGDARNDTQAIVARDRVADRRKDGQ